MLQPIEPDLKKRAKTIVVQMQNAYLFSSYFYTWTLSMKYFVEPHSIVRKIWSKSDTILFIFAGSAAEFALNKAVDWLYFTGRLPSDPLGRLFSTVQYARKIVFSEEEEALRAIDTLKQIHQAVEEKRGSTIPDWAYRDVLFMLIHYSIASYELLEKKLSEEEKEDVYEVFFRLGVRMELRELPGTYREWLPVREVHLHEDLQASTYSNDLFKQYKKHLGTFRYNVLIEGQKLVIPERVKKLLFFRNVNWLKPIVPIYKISRLVKLDRLIKYFLLPSAYQDQIKALDRND
jgi:hypothetical protein